ncbi:hypothetical protein OH76DRAFT_1403264 [Lentinus brumalis]|uniref:Prolyl 4-hydroxylase alpha subunit Fe(2+) 2OG dioxygenase domain-containing protein n=1 Tax=Lentinus brumalis TaxID=2498619 RepID=A0A371DBU5_9APHY|nr:hypothetical protein OH76DRAFT_1403264 [Polyporus brumalis]
MDPSLSSESGESGESVGEQRPLPAVKSSHGSSPDGAVLDCLQHGAGRGADAGEDQDSEEGGGGGEEADGDEEVVDETPCKDIRDKFADISSGDVKFTPAFSFNRAYPAAPNPIIDIDGLGALALPLNIREATAIKQCAEQLLNGKVDNTIVDTSVPNVWEIDASRVRFENTAWRTFMARTVRDVCEVLGVDYKESRARYKLDKLILHETGSHLLPRVDTEEVNGKFATIVVVLPSRFTGGAVRVAHGKLSEVYDNSADSLATTSVLAWYAGAKHEVRRIASGYRLALSFSVIHKKNVPRPTFSMALRKGAAARLRQVFQQWKTKHGDYPRKLIYLLSHENRKVALRRSALKGADADLVALLEDVGKPHGFHLGLARLACRVMGSTGYSNSWDDDSDYDDDLGMIDVHDTEVEVDHLTDLDGGLIHEDGYLDHLETEFIPKELVEETTSEAYDDQDCERDGDRGNWSTSVTRSYNRTILVIWPEWANHDIRGHGSSGRPASSSPRRTPEKAPHNGKTPRVAPTRAVRAAVAPSSLRHPVAGTTRSRVQATSGAAASYVKHGPPAKRRKTAYDAAEVIDLT